MRRLFLLIAVVSTATFLGCAALGDATIDGLIDTIFEDEHEIDPRILKRKGIEPGSKRHKRLLAEEQAAIDLKREMESDDWP